MHEMQQNVLQKRVGRVELLLCKLRDKLGVDFLQRTLASKLGERGSNRGLLHLTGIWTVKYLYWVEYKAPPAWATPNLMCLVLYWTLRTPSPSSRLEFPWLHHVPLPVLVLS